MKQTYRVAGHAFEVKGNKACMAAENIEGFKPFSCHEQPCQFCITEADNPPLMETVTHTFVYEDVTCTFGCTKIGYLLTLKPANEEAFFLWNNKEENIVHVTGNWSLRLYRFGFWVGFGLMTLSKQTIAIHSSCIVCNGKAVLFLGESGTGKSTHTQLWREHIPGARLLNDDSPILRIEEGRVWAYGSPWSGKTPCYKNERYELAGCVRLSQARANEIRKLTTLQAYGAIHPSCPPSFAYNDELYDLVSHIIGEIISSTPIFHLACLPNKEAALLSYKTIMDENK